ncbi:hypothetical protein BC938DRAFT_481094 [Jimgerdemannia flammicorona]|uniref:Uncharacterized protein n=1 Tax=Jimgerdemannia flammicorona TaxID=994334 RepID=A0A433QGZ4_9FUNG|nr:hypothetical protein BC938DRAFT_481094 [Jimgerdemannia flammicorona]
MVASPTLFAMVAILRRTENANVVLRFNLFKVNSTALMKAVKFWTGLNGATQQIEQASELKWRMNTISHLRESM